MGAREARQVLDNFLDKWELEDPTNPNFEEAVKREVARVEDLVQQEFYLDTQDDLYLC